MKALFCLITGLSALTVPPEHQRTYEQIVAYEKLFQNVEIEHHGESYKRDEKGILQEQDSGGSIVYYAKGNLKREDVSYDDEPGRTVVSLTNGELSADWSRFATDPAGQASIQPVENLSLAISTVGLLNPFYMFTDPSPASPRVSEITLDAIEGDTTVTVRLHYGKNVSYDFEYERFGDYLRPLTVGSRYVPKDGPPEENISLRYHYGKGPDGKDLVYPVTIEHISELHNIHVTHTLTRVNFSPKLDDSLFAFTFAEGTWVTDRITGISKRNYSAGQSLKSLADEISTSVSDGSRATDGSDPVALAVARKPGLDRAAQDLKEARKASAGNKPVAIIVGLLLVVVSAACIVSYRTFLRRKTADSGKEWAGGDGGGDSG